MKHYFLLFTVLTIVLTGASLALRDSPATPTPSPPQPADAWRVETFSQAPGPAATAPPLEQPLEQVVPPPRREPPSRLWEIPIDKRLQPDALAQQGIHAQPVQLDHVRMRQLVPGDAFSALVPQTGNAYQWIVDDRHEHANGNLTLTGDIQQDDPAGGLGQRWVITMSPQSSFATFSTLDGNFQLEATDDVGWVIALADLDALIDTTQDDYRIPQDAR